MSSSARGAAAGLGVALAAAVGVAAAVLGVAALRGGDGPVAGPVTEPTVLGEELLTLDVGDLTETEALQACATERFAAGGAVEVAYGVRQLSAEGKVPVVVLRNAEGDLRMCDVTGADGPAVFPLPTASAQEPVVALANGRRAWDCTGAKLERFSATLWLGVSDQVAVVRQRYWVDGVPGPWFNTEAKGGLAHLQTWVDGPLRKGTELTVEHEVLDADGAPVAQDLLPTEPAEVGWCSSGDVEIG